MFNCVAAGDILVESSLSGLTNTAYDMFIYVYDGNTLVGPRSLTVKISGMHIGIKSKTNENLCYDLVNNLF